MSTARESADGTMWTSLLHAGLAGSFMRFPHVPARTEALREAKAGAAIYGVPFDATSPGRSSGRWMSSPAGRTASICHSTLTASTPRSRWELARPTPGGLTSIQAIDFVRGVSAPGLLGVDVVEVAPSLDPTPATALIGGRIALEAMSFHAGAGNGSAAGREAPLR